MIDADYFKGVPPMNEAQRSIWSLLCQTDPGGRNLLPFVPMPDLRRLSQELEAARRVLIITGFPVLHAGGAGETDGPSGAAALAAALLGAGKTVTVVTDENCLPPVLAACAFLAPGAGVHSIPKENAAAACAVLLEELDPTLVVALERPGKAADGHYYNFRSKPIDALLADTQPLFTRTRAVTVAIGDGGNELGMGALADAVCRTAPNGALVCARETADVTLAAGVSNWWGWGVAALLSLIYGRDLLPSDGQELELLRRVTAAGGVDGVSGRPELTVDGLSLEENLSILDQLRQIVANSLEKNRCAAPLSIV